MRIITVAALSVFLCVSLANAQPLADHVPANAIEYIAWKGTDNLASQYNQSHLKEFLDSSQVRQFIGDNLPLWLGKTANNPQAEQIIAKALEVGEILTRHPTVLMVCMDENQKVPLASILCDAGADSEELQTKLTDFIALTGDRTMKVNTVDQLTSFNLMRGTPVKVDAQNSLATDPDFQSAMAQCLKDPAFVFYIHPNSVVKDQMPNLDQFLWTSGFDGKNWSDQLLFKVQKSSTVPRADDAAMADLMQSIPASATIAGANNLDFPHLINDLNGLMNSFSPGAESSFQNALKQTQMDLQAELFSALGTSMAYYVEDPKLGVFAPGAMRLVFVNRPTNMQQALAGLNKLAPMIPFGLSVAQGTRDNGLLFFGPSPAFVKIAAARAAGDSMLTNPAFVELRKKLNAPEKLDGFTFYDLPQTLAGEYPMVVLLGQQGLAQSGVLGQQMLASLLPTPEKLTASLEPSGSVQWTDDKGIHLRGLTPFPGSEILAAPEGAGCALVTRAARIAAAMRPLFQGQEQQRQMFASQANLRAIDVSLMAYATAHQNTLPPDLGTLIKTQDIPLNTFLSPATGNTLPPDWQNWSPDQEADWVNAHSDYEFLGADLKIGKKNNQIVVLHEKNTGDGAMVNLAFADGHVEMLSKAVADAELAQSLKLQGK